MVIERKVAGRLRDAKKTLAVAESCTGGLLSHRLTNIPGSSDFLKVGIVAYSNEAKIKLLKVPVSLIRKHGAVSEAVAVAMAQGVRQIHPTDFGVAITGIAGPTGGSKTKPVGLIYIAVAARHETLCGKYQFQGTRTQIKSQAANQALKNAYLHCPSS